MQFLYSPQASEATLTLDGEVYKYLFKVRRFGEGKVLDFRNMQDDKCYRYRVTRIGKKEATLIMIESYHDSTKAVKRLHILWCMIDTKVIEKTLPMLNQIGVSKITFFYCDRSQKNFKLEIKRAKKILINSSQQCGRSDLMELEILETLDAVMEKYHDFAVMDFGGKVIDENISTIMIGCEGGFSENEREKLKEMPKIGIKSPFILKSETAALSFAAKVLI
jgi:16S rRNA (uracil1498-N3)-methyltransferase